ncbi:LysR family transcriptional regulator [Noviherbaspirillum pedocola]|uniref:LysR family transcriptional regulator n=1 Tax=Noviherbaspirillum pedocola TaxID=2801341 RepID=A0A934W949_9BURK|nr:LysR family transcriptional regulator [Noviherbaspirillum pedocola]MBK4738370.1 LysR family transcriptional regulator [Noviherbaspirillum pedocola]
MDRLDALKVFCSVVDAGGFRRAADRLGISTTSVTTQVAALEAHFRVKLLNRTTRSMSVTEEGRQCYENAMRLLADMNELEDVLRHSTTAPSGLLRVDMPGIIGTRIISPALPRFLTDYPEVTVRMSANDRLVDMVDEGIDVLVRIGNLVDSRLVAQTLAGTRYVCCASPDYLARRGSPTSPEDLDRFACLNFLYPKSRRVRPWYFQRDGQVSSIAPRGIFVTDHVESLIGAAIAGGGIIQVLSVSVQDRIASGALVPLLTDWTAPGPDVAVLFQQRQLRAAKVKVFVDFLHEIFRTRPHGMLAGTDAL